MVFEFIGKGLDLLIFDAAVVIPLLVSALVILWVYKIFTNPLLGWQARNDGIINTLVFGVGVWLVYALWKTITASTQSIALTVFVVVVGISVWSLRRK